jgi:hypothetical protein
MPRTASKRDTPEFDALAVKVSHALRAALATGEAPVAAP